MKTDLKQGERVWLEELHRRMVAGIPSNHREMLVELRDRLPRGFRLEDVDYRLRSDKGPSAWGLLQLGTAGDLLKDLERAILYIREELIKNPALAEMRASQLAEGLKIDAIRAQNLLQLVGSVGQLAAGYNDADARLGFSSIALGGESTMAEYMAFDGLEKALSARVAKETPAPLPRSALAMSNREEARNTAFVLMNMDPNEPSLTDVLSSIKRVCREFGVTANRIDDVEHQDRITDRVLEMIESSELLIADLSGERPNVYYEVGYAHALGKRPILYRRKGTALHFDLAVHNVPEYANITDLESKLRGRLAAVLGRGPKASV